MYIKRVVIKNFRNLKSIDLHLDPGLTCLVGENNSGKSNFIMALRLVLDTNYPNYFRKLSKEDFFSGTDISVPQQILISIQFTDFDSTDDESKIKEHALAHACCVDDEISQLCYRFRPKQVVRQAIESGERTDDLIIEDYEWELVGGAVPDSDGTTKDLVDVEWDDEFSGGHVKFNALEAFCVTYLPAIRDVEDDLKRISSSPLHKLLEIQDISEVRKEALVSKIQKVNTEIVAEPEIVNLKNDVDSGFNETVGSVFSLNVSLGMADTTFLGLSRSLRMLLTGSGLDRADISRNGLGINNALYISMLLKYFEKLIQKDHTAGELLLVEEPEAHLHPQLQHIIFSKLLDKKCQVLATTHSTHITSHASLSNFAILTPIGNEVVAKVPVNTPLSVSEKEDLERYLDATKSILLFAKRVILVEGMSEVFLIPKLVKKVMEIDLEGLGISVVPIHGVHFHAYAKLFGKTAIPKKCLILTDGDLKPSDAADVEDEEVDQQEFPRLEDLLQFRSEYVEVKHCHTTFERAVAIHGNLKMFSSAASELGAPQISRLLLRLHNKESLSNEEGREARDRVLNTAVRFGKARFAQVASKYVDEAEDVPPYIREGINWIVS